MERLRDEQSLLVVPGDQFGMDGFLRIGLGNEPEDLKAGLLRMDSVLESLGPAPGFEGSGASEPGGRRPGR
jgi:aspartate/methionine/tyrosine aminotransferase